MSEHAGSDLSSECRCLDIARYDNADQQTSSFMALPDNHATPPDPGTNFGTSPTKRLWSRVVSNHRESIIHHTAFSPQDTSGVTFFKTLVWRNGRSPGSVIFDVSARKETQLQLMELIKEQFPLRRGLCFVKEGPKSLCEVNFPESLHEEIDRACSEGLRFKDNMVIAASPALDSSTKLTRLNLSRLPFKDQPDLLAGLRQSLAPYGRILDLGICREPSTQTYSTWAPVTQYLTLRHVLTTHPFCH